MKIFISWSGEPSKAVATALREWLPRVIQNVQPWISNHDIPSGSRWNARLSEQLQDLKTGILCLTPENLSAPWILFEAGALSKTLDDSLVCPYLFQLEPSAVEWPLAQFQLETANKEGTKRLLATINNAAGESKLEAGHLEDAFEMWWPRLHEKLSAIQPATTTPPARENRELLEEILNEVRVLSRQARRETRDARIMALRNLPLHRHRLVDDAALSNLSLDEALALGEKAKVDAATAFKQSNRTFTGPSKCNESRTRR